jgi:Ca-activated chloride channel family protein
MKAALIIILFLVPVAVAQSGRRKPSPTPTPKPISGPSVVSGPAKGVSLLPGPVVKGAKPTPATDNDETIKVESVLVPIPVSVLDGNGRPLTALDLAEFELRIDGKVVEIGDLSRSETPIRMAMLFDNSSSVLMAREFEKEAAIRFFKRVLRPDRDKAALFSVADYTRLEQPITSDISLLTRAIDLFPEPKGATALFDGIIEVAKYLVSSNGRRVVVIVSDGEDTYSEPKNTLEKVIEALQLNDCQVYVVKTKDFENYKRTGMRGGNANIRSLTAERRMIELAQATGGAVYSPIDEKELDAAFKQISAELSQQYMLSYYPEDDTGQAGDFRSISVSVKNRPNANLRTRKGYYVRKN